jgi:hypothetical protein
VGVLTCTWYGRDRVSLTYVRRSLLKLFGMVLVTCMHYSSLSSFGVVLRWCGEPSRRGQGWGHPHHSPAPMPRTWHGC